MPANPPPAPPPPAPQPATLALSEGNYRQAMGLGFAFAETVMSLAGANQAIFALLRPLPAGQAGVNNPCGPGGSITADYTDNDRNTSLSAGDRFDVRYTGCLIEDTTIAARMQIYVRSMVRDNGADRVTLGADIANFTFTSPGSTVNFHGHLEWDWELTGVAERYRVTTADFTVDFPGGSDRLRGLTVEYRQNYSTNNFTYSLAGEVITGSYGGGSFTFGTDTTLAGPLFVNPLVGVMTFRGAANSAVRIDEGGNADFPGDVVDLLLDLDGDGVYVAPATTFAWSSIVDMNFFEPLDEDFMPDPNAISLQARPLQVTGGTLGGMVFDAARGVLYVAATDRNEIAVISTATYQVVERIAVGSKPAKVALSPDGNTLFVALGRGGAVATLDLNTRQLSRIETAVAANSSQTTEVSVVGNKLHVAALTQEPLDVGAANYLVQVDRAAGNAVTRGAAGTSLPGGLRLAPSADGHFLYVGQEKGLTDIVHKLDLSQAGAPIVASRTLSNADIRSLALSPNGDYLVLRNGWVLRTSDLQTAYTVESARAYRFSADGSRLIGWTTLPAVLVYDTQNFQMVQYWRPSCSAGTEFEPQLAQLSGSNQWAVATGTSICAFSLDEPQTAPGQAGPPGPNLPPDPELIDVAVTHAVTVDDPLLARFETAVAIDRQNGFLYAGLVKSFDHQLLMYSLTDNTVAQRVHFSGAAYVSALALDDDGSRAYAAFAQLPDGVHRVGVFDTAVRTMLAPLDFPYTLLDETNTGATSLSELGWLGGNRLLVTGPDNGGLAAHVVQLDVDTGLAARIGGGEQKFRGSSPLLVTPDRTEALLVSKGNGVGQIQRIDTSIADPDLIFERSSTELGGSFVRPAVSDDGAVLYTNGVAVDRRTLMLRGETVSGTPLPSADPAIVYVFDNGNGIVQLVDTQTYVIRARYRITGCSQAGSSYSAVMRGMAPKELIALRSNTICRVTLP